MTTPTAERTLQFGSDPADSQIWIDPEIQIRISNHFWLRKPKYKGSGALGIGGGICHQSALVSYFMLTKKWVFLWCFDTDGWTRGVAFSIAELSFGTLCRLPANQVHLENWPLKWLCVWCVVMLMPISLWTAAAAVPLWYDLSQYYSLGILLRHVSISIYSRPN